MFVDRNGDTSLKQQSRRQSGNVYGQKWRHLLKTTKQTKKETERGKGGGGGGGERKLSMGKRCWKNGQILLSAGCVIGSKERDTGWKRFL